MLQVDLLVDQHREPAHAQSAGQRLRKIIFGSDVFGGDLAEFDGSLER